MGKDLVTAYYNVDYEKNTKVIITFVPFCIDVLTAELHTELNM